MAGEQGEYIYKCAPKDRSIAAVKRDLATLEYVNQHSFPYAPELLKTSSGEDCVAIAGQATYVLKKVSGKTPLGSAADWHALGSIAGILHRLPFGPADTAFTQASVVPDLLAHSDTFSFKAQYDNLVSGLDDIESLPKAIIHTDIGLNNSICTEDGEYILVDWDDAGNGVRVLDVAFPLLNAFVDLDTRRLKHDEARAFYSAYAEHITLTEAEKKSLFSAAMFYALMYMEFGETDKKWQILVEWIIPNRVSIERTILEWL